MSQLIINIDPPILKKAQYYAQMHETSVDDLISQYLASLTHDMNNQATNNTNKNDLAHLLPASLQAQVNSESIISHINLSSTPVTDTISGMFADIDTGEDYKTLLADARKDKFL